MEYYDVADETKEVPNPTVTGDTSEDLQHSQEDLGSSQEIVERATNSLLVGPGVRTSEYVTWSGRISKIPTRFCELNY